MMFVYLFVFFIGLCLGSFSNVLIWRIPKGLSIGGRSVCRKCRNKISWFDNIPLLSFVLLYGKCRNCKSKISLRYPLVELLTGFIFLFIYLKFAYSYETLFFLLLSPILISIFFIDLNHQIIPDELVFAGIIIVFLYRLLFPVNNSFYTAIFAGFLSSFVLLVLHLITKGKGMGLGDVKFAILGGMMVGLNHVFFWFFMAFLTGAVIGCILILTKRYGLKSKIAFGPFLILALFLTILYKI